ncbi:universal stress protein [Streptomyces sp. NPDC048638]|uniref:universal stress protein n=1 Tax=Streptomyces sp. NPDC048638 TaxID=3365580 RepID=UPI003711C586
MRQALDAVHQRHPQLQAIEDLVGSEAEPALLRAAGESQMLVLGSRAVGAWESYVLGDVSLDVVGRAEGPVVLVRAPRTAPPRDPVGAEAPPVAREPRIVLGMSLRAPCERLLAFAFDAAAGRGIPLAAVHGRPLPLHAYAPWGVDPDVAADVVKEADAELRAALRPWRERFPDVAVQMTVLPENPARALVQTAPGAELLVVGRRPHGRAPAPRVGAVAHAAIHHVTCPVAVVPHD